MPPTALASRRTFSRGGQELVTPVDSLGRMRFRATLDRSALVRDDNNDSAVGFAGHAAVFNKRTWIGGRSWGFWEEIAPGAFRKTIGEADVRFLNNHDPNLLIARNKAGTLRLAEDDVGLAVDADMDTRQSYVNDLSISLDRGDITQMSFAFEPIAWSREELDDGEVLYRMTELRLWDVSTVTYPAYEETDAALRALGFDALTRSLNLDSREVLERVGQDDLVDEYLKRQIATAPAEATQTEPVPATRSDDDSAPPATATGNSNALALRHRAAAVTL